MSDKELALEFLKIKYKNEEDIKSYDLINSYTYFIDNIEKNYSKNRIRDIKEIFKEKEGKLGSWCDYEGIQMLEKIKKIVDGGYNE